MVLGIRSGRARRTRDGRPQLSRLPVPADDEPRARPVDWEADFVDYFYLSFTNATAFSPTDVMPLSRWAKLIMLVQSAVSLMLAVLVIARAVNILK